MISQKALDTMFALEMKQAKLGTIDPDVAKFLYLQVLATQAKTLVEVGAGAGYATIWLGLAAELTGGKLKSYEIDPEKAAMARQNIEKAGLSAVVEIITADAREALRSESHSLDFVYLDADKDQYETYFDVVYKQLQPGSLLIADRVLYNESELADYVSYMQNHPNLDSVTVPMADGLEITVKVE